MRLFSLLVFSALLAGCSPMFGGDLLIGYPHTIAGEVVKEPSTRYVRSGIEGAGGEEKVSLTLDVDPIMIAGTLETAYSPSTHQITVECVSTRCAQVEIGEQHELVCRGVFRLLEPNIVNCKHSKQL